VNADVSIAGDGAPGRFATTRWSLILRYANSETATETSRDALTELCRSYWRPIFEFLCRRGYSVPDAQDLAQDFFIIVIKGNLLSFARPNRGRFRSLLLKSLQNFLNDNYDWNRAAKRGGGKDFVPWHEWMAESPSQFSMRVHGQGNWTPEKAFDVTWAVTVTEQALRRLAHECENSGRRRIFNVLSKYLMTERGEVSYAKLSLSLKVSERSVKRLLHHFRVRYRNILRDEISQTVETAADINDETRYLCEVLATSGA
jgi:DNA-directed RNA polymerase specialized sigma24 family protein